MGPNSRNTELQETNDISHMTPDGRQTNSGSLEWENDDASDKTFSLTVKPRSGQEIQKTFYITIFDVQGFPADVGNGELSPTADTFSLTVSS